MRNTQTRKSSVWGKKHMQHIWHIFVAIQQWQSMQTHEKHQRKQQQPRVLGWSQPDSTASYVFMEGFLPLRWECGGSSMVGDSLQVWGAKVPHLSALHLSHHSLPRCLQLRRHRHHRSSWRANFAPQNTEMVTWTVFLLVFPCIYIWSCT